MFTAIMLSSYLASKAELEQFLEAEKASAGFPRHWTIRLKDYVLDWYRYVRTLWDKELRVVEKYTERELEADENEMTASKNEEKEKMQKVLEFEETASLN
jgi:hypothetical protein